MKQGLLVPTKNTRQADISLAELQNRPKLEMVGLGMIYGAPGLGKTTYAERNTFRNGWVYIRLSATSTTKTFLRDLLQKLHRKLGDGNLAVSGTKDALRARAAKIMAENSQLVVMVDEIDYAFRQPEMLGVIRDLVDESLAIVILVGMENAKDKLLQVNRYYYDRCSQFYQFKPADEDDLGAIMEEIMDVEYEAGVVPLIQQITGGNLRQAVNVLDALEKDARAVGAEKITVAAVMALMEGLKNKKVE